MLGGRVPVMTPFHSGDFKGGGSVVIAIICLGLFFFGVWLLTCPGGVCR